MNLRGSIFLHAALKVFWVRVKAVTAHGLGKRIWQGGFQDHALRQKEDLAKLALYIVANPLRAGLAKRVGDYPHRDVVWL